MVLTLSIPCSAVAFLSNSSMPYRKNILIVGIYTLLTLVLTYPVSVQLSSHLAGFGGEDNLQWRWFLWWFKHALLTLQTPITQVSLLYAPLGGQQPLYAISAYVPALALPITLFAGPTVSFNISFLLSFILSGYTAYLLAYYLTQHRLAAVVAGLIFAFYPARFGYATGTFLGQLTVYLLPVYVLALLMLAHRPTWRRAIWTALVLACLGLTWPLHVAYGIFIFTGAILLWQLVVWLRQPQDRRAIKYFLVTFGLAFVLVIGFYGSLLSSILQGQYAHLGETDSVKFSLDLLAPISPSNYHPILRPLGWLPDYATRVLADRDDIQERLAYLGLVPLFLAGVGLIRFGRKLLLWLIIALVTLILSLGPILKFNGDLLRFDIDGYTGFVVLPYAFIRSLPVFDWSETLGRLTVPAMLCLAVMAAYGTMYLLNRFKAAWRPALVSLLSLLILLEYVTIFPFPTAPDTVPDFYYRLRQEGQQTPQKIIDLPLKGEPIYTNYAMHYQTVHQQPIAGGHFIREPAGAAEMTDFINQLLSPPKIQTAFVYPDPQERLSLLNRFGFTKIVNRQWLMTDETALAQLSYLSSWLGQPRPAGQVSVFEVPPGTGSIQPVVSLLDGEGWQVADDLLQLQTPAEVLVYLNEAQPRLVSLTLSLNAAAPDRYLNVALDGRRALRLYLASEWLDYQIPLRLPPGAHRLTFYPEEACSQACEPVNFSQIQVQPAPDELTTVSFGHQLSLIQHDLSTTRAVPGQPLLIYLYWQNQERLPRDYSAFVHLVSPSGQLLAQADYLLGDWLYPTSQWPSGHITAVPTLFFVPPDAPPGEYRLLAGLYQANDGERLLVDSASQPVDAALIANITIGP